MEILVVATGLLSPGFETDAPSFVDRSNLALTEVPGFVRMTLWRSVPNPSRHLLLSQYRSVEAANDGLDVLAEKGLLLQSMGMLDEAPEVYRVEVRGTHGATPDATRVFDYLTMSQRLCDPGQSEQGLAELAEILESMRILNGNIGDLYGPSESLPDQLFSLIFWRGFAEAANSLPNHKLYAVEAFERLR